MISWSPLPLLPLLLVVAMMVVILMVVVLTIVALSDAVVNSICCFIVLLFVLFDCKGQRSPRVPSDIDYDSQVSLGKALRLYSWSLVPRGKVVGAKCRFSSNNFYNRNAVVFAAVVSFFDITLRRCFLLPRSRQTLAYLMDSLQAGIAFSQR